MRQFMGCYQLKLLQAKRLRDEYAGRQPAKGDGRHNLVGETDGDRTMDFHLLGKTATHRLI